MNRPVQLEQDTATLKSELARCRSLKDTRMLTAADQPRPRRWITGH